MTATIDLERKAVANFQRDPVLWSREIHGATLLPFQARVLRSVVANKRTAVVTAPGVGKTFTAAMAVLWFWSSFPFSRVITTGPTSDHIDKILWPEIRKLHGASKVPLGGRLLTTTLDRPGEDWQAYGVSTNRPAAFGGAHKRFQFVVVDDAHGVPDEIRDIINTNLMSGEHCRLLEIGNPKPWAVRGYRKAFRPGSGYVCFSMSRLDHPNYTEKREVVPGAFDYREVDAMIAEYGDGSQEVAVDVKGEWFQGSESVLIPQSWFEQADTDEPRIECAPHMGVDVSRAGTDYCVATITKNNVVVCQEAWQSADLTVSADRVEDIARRESVSFENVHVDVGGVGGGVVDMLRRRGLSVDAVDFGGGPVGDHHETVGGVRFANRRAELHWVAREFVRQKIVRVPKRYWQIWRDLSAPTFKDDHSGRRLIESKDDVKKKIKCSPDYGDSFVLSLSRACANYEVRWI